MVIIYVTGDRNWKVVGKPSEMAISRHKRSIPHFRIEIEFDHVIDKNKSKGTSSASLIGDLNGIL